MSILNRAFSTLNRYLELPAPRGAAVADEGAGELAGRAVGDLRGLLLIVGTGLLFGLYFVFRYAGYWSEGDTVVFLRAIERLQITGSIFSPLRYDHGYAYSVWMATLSNLTGIPAPSFTRWISPVIGNLFLAVFGYAAFRSLLRSNRLALIASVLLFLVPELVFTVSRGNHEKLTVGLTLLAALLLVEGVAALLSPSRRFLPWALCYLMVAFVLVSLNSIFGSTFIVATTGAFGLITLAFLMFAGVRRRLGRIWLPMGALVLLSWGVFLLVVVVVYPQADSKLRVVRDAVEGILHLFDEREVVTNPYESYGTASGGQWLNSPVAQVLSSFRWLLFAGSFASWVALLLHSLRHLHQVTLRRLLLLTLYGAYGLIMAVAFPIDFLGLSAGDNLNVRLYTYFALFAVPLLAFGINRVVARVSERVPWRVTSTVLTALFAVFALISFTKATLDPLLSNFWMVYWPEEPRAVDFWAARQESSFLYGRARVRAAYVSTYGHDVEGTNYVRNDQRFLEDVYGDDEMPFSHSLDSALHRAEMTARRSPEVLFSPQDRVYDNGRAQILHRTPLTPFQR